MENLKVSSGNIFVRCTGKESICMTYNDHRFRHWAWGICVRQPNENIK